MKELSIEDKAKRYDEAIERAKSLIGDTIIEETGQHIVEVIFPELKESEDKKIKEWLIRLINTAGYRELDTDKMPCSRKNVIAWLEKQGEKKVSYTTLAETGNGGINALVTKELPTNGCNEQKPANTPKFKVGDWIIDIQGVAVNQIIGHVDGSYRIKTSCSEFYLPMKLAEKNYRLWTIQDAKDGDVLVDAYGNIGIFEQYDDFDWVSYCSLGHNGGFQHFKIEHENENTYPATKEQRDQLENAMADAGYTFDFENKELKKIVIPIFNSGDAIIKKNNSDINKFGQFTITDITGGKYWYNDRIICDISEQYEWELVEQKPISFDTSTPVSYDDIPFGDKVIIKQGEQKPTWSEEDEARFESCIKILQTSDGYDTINTKWLKSLKDRVQPQQKQEWSEEDARICRAIICDIANDKSICKFEISKSICDEQINWLKSLKQRIGG